MSATSAVKLWEIRLKGRAGIARAIHVTARESSVSSSCEPSSRTETTPKSEIDVALQRAKELRS